MFRHLCFSAGRRRLSEITTRWKHTAGRNNQDEMFPRTNNENKSVSFSSPLLLHQLAQELPLVSIRTSWRRSVDGENWKSDKNSDSKGWGTWHLFKSIFHDRKPNLPTGRIHLTDLKHQICCISVLMFPSSWFYAPITCQLFQQSSCVKNVHMVPSMCSSLINKCRDNDSLEGHQDRENDILKNLLANTDINKDGQHIPTSSHMKLKHPEQRFCHLVPVKWVGPGVGSLKEPKQPNRDRDFLCGIKWCPF